DLPARQRRPPDRRLHKPAGGGAPSNASLAPAWSNNPDRGGIAMAYDENLAARIRELVAGEKRVTEKKMFGGLAFLVGGHMAVAASGRGGMMVRVDPAESDALVAKTNARVMEMRGREMPGWLRVDTNDVKTRKQLEVWVQRGVGYARSLPPKS